MLSWFATMLMRTTCDAFVLQKTHSGDSAVSAQSICVESFRMYYFLLVSLSIISIITFTFMFCFFFFRISSSVCSSHTLKSYSMRSLILIWKSVELKFSNVSIHSCQFMQLLSLVAVMFTNAIETWSPQHCVQIISSNWKMNFHITHLMVLQVAQNCTLQHRRRNKNSILNKQTKKTGAAFHVCFRFKFKRFTR